jgi:hypothetical protein
LKLLDKKSSDSCSKCVTIHDINYDLPLNHANHMRIVHFGLYIGDLRGIMRFVLLCWV